MKKLLLFVLAVSRLHFFSQNTADIFTSETLIYYGIDFSNARLVGDFGNGSGYDMKNKMFNQWNNVVVKEQPKYDIAGAFRKSSVYYDLAPVEAENDKTDDTKILTPNNDHKIDAGTLQEMVKKYSGGEKKEGVGLVFIVEKFDKTREVAIVHVTLFDIASKKILLTEKMQGTPNGVGLRNYWAKAIYLIIRDITDYKYGQWKKTAGK